MAKNEGLEIPRHIAIILDGNGRWAKRRGLPRTAGHKQGAEAFRRMGIYCKKLGVEYLTVYAFSTENWKRSSEEVTSIIGLLKRYLQEAIDSMVKDEVLLRIVGDTTRFSDDVRELMRHSDAITAQHPEYTFQANACLNYGGRDEIVRAARKFAEDCVAGRRRPEDLNEDLFSSLLDTSGIPDPDLLIRPGGEQRLSNFLLWQCAYAEFYFTDVLWPDFDEAELDKAIAAYRARDRRYGNVT